MIEWCARDWDPLTVTELEAFLARLRDDTVGVMFYGNVEIAEG